MDILFRLRPGAKRPSSKESAIFTAKITKQTNTHTHKRQAHTHIYIYLHICHAHDKHVRLHKITQVPPKQHNSEPQASAWLYIGNAWKQLPNVRLLHQSERLSSVAQPCRIITLEAMTACKWSDRWSMGGKWAPPASKCWLKTGYG